MSGTKQPTDDIIHDLVNGDRHPIDDADQITVPDGLESIELTHCVNDGESVVVLAYSPAIQFRRDPGDPMSEFDIFDAEATAETEAKIAAEPGDRRYDCEQEKAVVVVATHANVPAAEWGVLETRRTVAEHNPTYPADDRVIEAVYVDSIDSEIGSDGLSPAETVARRAAEGTLDERTVRCYAFPESRLPEEPEES